MVSIRNVSKRFGALEVLKDVSLDIPRSQVFAFIGPSGAGKSTLVRTINALEGIQAGEIFVDGISVADPKTDINALRANIGFVAQSFNLYPHLRVLDNVTLAPVHVKKVPKAEAEEKGAAILASLGLADKVAAFPAQLSGGQQQRVAIARALAMEPKLMLFDEPTSALDPELIKEVLDAIRGLAETGITMVVVTHEMNFAREICDRIVFMADGRILETASPGEFFTAPKTERARDFLGKILNR
ncbi:amino acid ABC transporter ATP-binding protein [Aminiphilus sp.]|uniref:amino acid ABC transporter ATP-binding protein n=1 Tax=Aminiphilus sp. TaxID=1872488 RepID=UPI00341AF218